MTTPDGYAVEIREAGDAFDVVIVDAGGDVVSRRACRTEDEARTYASTVRQHLRWLSSERFRAYYRIGD